jgi:hypothetical protein
MTQTANRVNSKETTMIFYNPDKDRSEEFGWKKLRDEYSPTEREQDLWGLITIIFSLIMITIGGLYGI